MASQKKAKKNNPNGFLVLLGKIGAKIAPYVGKLLKAVKFLKFGLAAATFASYSYMYTWKFAILLMIAIGWHESGHVWAMRKLGMKTKGFYFLPFLGGAAISEENAKSYASWSFVSIMGPIWGLGLAAVSCVIYYITGLPLFAGVTAFMALINLFNLFPVYPLDGGQIIRSIAFSIHRSFGFIFLALSIVASAFLMIVGRAGLFAFMLILGLADIILEYIKRRRITKQINTHLANAEEHEDNAATFVPDSYEHMFWKRNAERNKEKATKLQSSIPTSLVGWQFSAVIASYALTTIFAIVLIKLMAHVPGANIVNEFLADK